MDKILFSAYTDDEELAYSRVRNQYFLSDNSEPEWCQMIKPKYNKKLGQDDISVGLYISRGEGQHNVFFSRLLNEERIGILKKISAEQSQRLDAAEVLVRSQAFIRNNHPINVTNRSVDFDTANSNIFEHLNTNINDEIVINTESIEQVA